MPRKTAGATQGAKDLCDCLKVTSQASIARRVGVGQQTVSDWAAERCRPDAFYRLVLKLVCGIDPAKWFDASERRVIARLAQAAA